MKQEFTKPISMIKITAKQIKQLQSGELKESALVDALVDNYPVREIASAFVELLAMKEPVAENPITVSKADYDRVCGLFRVQGSSNRGRKKKGE